MKADIVRPSRSDCSPPVALPLRLRERGSDAWVEDANGVEVIARTHGFKSDKAHEDWCRWVVRAANADHQLILRLIAERRRDVQEKRDAALKRKAYGEASAWDHEDIGLMLAERIVVECLQIR